MRCLPLRFRQTRPDEPTVNFKQHLKYMESTNAIGQLRALENEVFTITEHKTYKSMMLSPEGLLLSSKRFDTPEAFREGFAKGGLLATMTTASYDKIKSFSSHGNNKTLSVNHKGIGLGMPGDLNFENGATDVHNILTYLEKVQGYNRTEAQMGAGKAILPNVFYVAFSLLCTFGMYGMANDPNPAEFSGRRQWAGQLADSLSKSIGPVGVLLLGIGITGFLGWQLWKKYQNPPVETRLER